jgi:hypothetical protein
MNNLSLNNGVIIPFEQQLPANINGEISNFVDFFNKALSDKRLLFCQQIAIDGDEQNEPTIYEKGFILITGVATNPIRSWALKRWEEGIIDNQEIILSDGRSIRSIVNIMDFPTCKFEHQIITKDRNEGLFALLLHSLATDWSIFDTAVLKPRVNPFELPPDFFS